MLTCITCSKQKTEEDDEEDTPRGNPNTKDAVKSLTTQIKDIALKVSGGHKGKHDQRGGIPYPFIQSGSSSSTPAWDFTRTSHPVTEPDSRFVAFGGDQTPGGVESLAAQSGEVVLEDEDQPKEWIAQVEPGVQITFVSLPRGGNDLKRIRFSREIFDKWQAQRWWGENYDRIMELYNVQRFNQQALNTPGRSEDGRDSNYSRLGSARESSAMQRDQWNSRCNRPYGHKDHYFPQEYVGNAGPSGCLSGSLKGEMQGPYMEASRMTSSSREDASVSISNASDIENEWIEEDEPGVYITIRQLIDGTRELRRVRFSREKFGEANAKLWWETNRDRIQAQYLC